MAHSDPVQMKRCYEFGPFRLDPSEQILLRDGQVVALTPKAFQTLLVLVENGTRTVTKEELLERVWPDTFVGEITLAQNISTLRKALADDRIENKYIETVPRRGYRFVSPVTKCWDDPFIEDAKPLAVFTDDIVREGSDQARLATHTAKEHSTYAPTKTSDLKVRAVWLGLITTAASVVAIGFFFLTNRERPQPPITRVRSIAVLPFTPLGTENRDESLELGMADALITKLSNIRQIV